MDREINIEEVVNQHILTTKEKDNIITFKICYCNCKFRECRCNNSSPLTRGIVSEIIEYFDITDLQSSIDKGIRLNAIHLYGVSELSTDNIKHWLTDYDVIDIEWINDYSCNVVFKDSTTSFVMMKNLGEPFVTIEPIKGEPEFIWYKSSLAPDKADLLLFRFANRGDVKLRGSRKRSEFYQKYGYPEIKKSRISNEKSSNSRRTSGEDDSDVQIVSYDDLPSIKTDYQPKLKSQFKKSMKLYSRESDSDNESPHKRRRMLTTMRLYSDSVDINQVSSRRVVKQDRFLSRHNNMNNDRSARNRLW